METCSNEAITHDYVVMRAEQRVSCADVQVMRGANCCSDHYTVRVRVKIELPRQQKKRPSALPFAVHTLRSVEKRCTYQQNLDQQLCEQPHTPGRSAEHNWSSMKRCIGSAAEAVVGRGKKKQLDWFLDAADTLLPLLDAKNGARD